MQWVMRRYNGQGNMLCVQQQHALECSSSSQERAIIWCVPQAYTACTAILVSVKQPEQLRTGLLPCCAHAQQATQPGAQQAHAGSAAAVLATVKTASIAHLHPANAAETAKPLQHPTHRPWGADWPNTCCMVHAAMSLPD
jgi:hypothetical protein